MITKTAYEEFPRYHKFLRTDGQGWLSTGETVASGTVTVSDNSDNSDQSATMVASVAPYGTPQTQLAYTLKAGTVGHQYKISIKIVSSAGRKLEDDLELRVV